MYRNGPPVEKMQKRSLSQWCGCRDPDDAGQAPEALEAVRLPLERRHARELHRVHDVIAAHDAAAERGAEDV